MDPGQMDTSYDVASAAVWEEPHISPASVGLAQSELNQRNPNIYFFVSQAYNV